MSVVNVVLQGGSPWGFRVDRGADRLLKVARLNTNGKAHLAGVEVDDVIRNVNGQATANLSVHDVMNIVHSAEQEIVLEIFRPVFSSSNLPLDNLIQPEEDSSTCSSGIDCSTHVPEIIELPEPRSTSVDLTEASMTTATTNQTLPFGHQRTNKSETFQSPEQKLTPPALPGDTAAAAETSYKLSLESTECSQQDSGTSLFHGHWSNNLQRRLPNLQNPTITLLKKNRDLQASKDNTCLLNSESSITSPPAASLSSNTANNQKRFRTWSSPQNELRSQTNISSSCVDLNQNDPAFNSKELNSSQDTSVEKSVQQSSLSAEKDRPTQSSAETRLLEIVRNRSPSISKKSDSTTSEGSETVRMRRHSLSEATYNRINGYKTRPVSLGESEISIQDSTGPKIFRMEKRLVKFEGIGPTDQKTGIPIATKNSVDESCQKDWYKCMFRSLHKTNENSDSKPFSSYVFAGTDPDPRLAVSCRPKSVSAVEDGVQDNRRSVSVSVTSPVPPHMNSRLSPRLSPSTSSTRSSPFSPNSRHLSHRASVGNSPKKPWQPADVRYQQETYRNQPRSIETYAPGRSSIAAQERSKNRYSLSCDVFDDDDSLQPNNDRKHQKSTTAQQQTMKVAPNTGTGVPSQSDVSGRPPASVRNSLSDLRSPVDASIQTSRSQQQQQQQQQHQQQQQQQQQPRIVTARNEGQKISGTARALYSFRPQRSQELSFERGDTIKLLRQMDKNWLEGEHGGRVGVFPASYIEIVPIDKVQTAQPAAASVVSTNEGLARAKYNFDAETSLELSFRKDALVTLVRQVDANWYEVQIENRRGIVPVSYLDIVKAPSEMVSTKFTNSYFPVERPSNSNSAPAASQSSRTLTGADTSTARNFQTSVHNSAQNNSPTRTGDGLRALGRRPSEGLQSPTNSVAYRQVTNARPNQDDYRRHSSGVADPLRTEPVDTRTASYRSDYGARSTSSYQDVGRSRTSENVPDTRLKYGAGYTQSQKDRMSHSSRYGILYDYNPRHPDELHLRTGDIVHVVNKCDDGWFWGTSERTRKFGTFPGNYAQLLR